VLSSLADQIDPIKLKAFVEQRQTSGEEDVKAFTELLPAGGTTVKIDVTSDWFMLQQQVVVGSARLALYSVIHRPGSNDPVVYYHSTDTP